MARINDRRSSSRYRPSARGRVDPTPRIFSAPKKALVWCAVWTSPQTFMRQRYRNVSLTGAHRRFGKGPVDDVALRVAAADLPQIEARLHQQGNSLLVAPRWNADKASTTGMPTVR
jgi:hypothetical protein